MTGRCKPSPPRLKSADAYQRLLMAILSGELAPAAQIDERGVARSYGFGQASVREALQRLALEGLVERLPRIGTRVSDLRVRDQQDVYEARLMVETYAAGLAAERATSGEIAAIREAYREHNVVAERRDIRRLIEIDTAFHGAIAAASRNAELARTALRLQRLACRFWVIGLERAGIEEIKAQGRVHLDLLDAIERRDPAEIEHVVRKAIGYAPDPRFAVFEPKVGLPKPPAAERGKLLAGRPVCEGRKERRG
jgi:DNA-binding GntR family transcriptional regulator